MVYTNPTINRLSRAIQKVISNKGGAENRVLHEERMSAMIYKYTKSLPMMATTNIMPSSGKHSDFDRLYRLSRYISSSLPALQPRV